MQPINIGCLNRYGTHVTPNNSTTNNVEIFLFRTWKQYTITTFNPSSQYLGQEKKNIFWHYIFDTANHWKLSEKPINMIMFYYWDKKLKKKKKKIACIGSWYNNNLKKKKACYFICLVQRMHFFIERILNDRHGTCFSNKSFIILMGCNLFWDTL